MLVPPRCDKPAGYCDSQGETCESSKNMPGREELMRASEKDAHMVFLKAKQQPASPDFSSGHTGECFP